MDRSAALPYIRFELAEKLSNKLGRAPGSLAPAPEFTPEEGKLGGMIN
jgi:hypothetical protein